jgi:hypothetical protein
MFKIWSKGYKNIIKSKKGNKYINSDDDITSRIVEIKKSLDFEEWGEKNNVNKSSNRRKKRIYIISLRYSTE